MLVLLAQINQIIPGQFKSRDIYAVPTKADRDAGH